MFLKSYNKKIDFIFKIYIFFTHSLAKKLVKIDRFLKKNYNSEIVILNISASLSLKE